MFGEKGLPVCQHKPLFPAERTEELKAQWARRDVEINTKAGSMITKLFRSIVRLVSMERTAPKPSVPCTAVQLVAQLRVRVRYEKTDAIIRSVAAILDEDRMALAAARADEEACDRFLARLDSISVCDATLTCEGRRPNA